MREIGFVAAVICAVFGFIGVVTVIAMFAIDWPSCAATTRDMRLAHRWSLWGGCQVFTPHEGWIPLDNLRVTSTVER